jgi:multidrug resistance efflux pump
VKSRLLLKYLLTATVVCLAIYVVWVKYQNYILNPWTRDGQVRAEVIQITPRVSGPIVNLPVKDNQFVKAGELLFEIDPRTFKVELAQSKAQYDKAKDTYFANQKRVDAASAQVNVSQATINQAQSIIKETIAEIEKNTAQYERHQRLLPQGATSQKSVDIAKANYLISLQKKQEALSNLAQMRATLANSEAALAEAQANLGEQDQANASLREAKATIEQAELNLEFTQVRAPVDGYITNLNLRLGSQTVANQPAAALIDVNSFWVDGFFKETTVGNIQLGDKAIVTLMSYPEKPMEGYVDSIGWGIAQDDGSTGFELLPNINPTFEWIRLAQRIPVSIQLKTVPDEVKLRVGTTASVLLMTTNN